MNKIFLTGAAAVLIGGLSTIAFCSTAQTAIAPVSAQFAEAGDDLLDNAKAEAAILQFETALAADPKNVHAYIGMARAYNMLGLPGRAVKFYREGLTIEPTNLLALEEQGEALMQRGAVSRAEDNLARIRELCGGDCDEAERLETVIAAGPPPLESAEAAEPQADVEEAAEPQPEPETETGPATEPEPEDPPITN